MAVYTCKFKAVKDHTVEVEHPFKGSVVVTLDGKKIKESAVHEFSCSFRVENKPCELSISYEEVNYGITKMQSCVHRFNIDGASIQAL